MEGPWSPGVQSMAPSLGPLANQVLPHNMTSNSRPNRPLVRAFKGVLTVHVRFEYKCGDEGMRKKPVCSKNQ